MSASRCGRLGYGTTARACRPLAAGMAIAVIIVASGWFSDANAAQKQRSRKKGRKPAAQTAESGDAKAAENAAAKRPRTKRRPDRLDKDVLRYLPDDCRAFGSFNMAPILQGKLGQWLTRENIDFRADFFKQFAPLDLKVEQIERIAFGCRSLDDGFSNGIAILLCKQPVERSDADLSANGTQWTAEKVGQQTIWTSGGEESFALCLVEDRIVLAGDPKTLHAVLKRNAPAKLPETLDRARKLLDPSAAIGVSILRSAAPDTTTSLLSSVPRGFVDRIGAINVEFDFDADLALRLAVLCNDDQTAEQLNDVAKAIPALVQLRLLDDQQSEVRELIRSIKSDVNGPVFTVSMKVPGAFVGQATGGIGAVVGSSPSISTAPACVALPAACPAPAPVLSSPSLTTLPGTVYPAAPYSNAGTSSHLLTWAEVVRGFPAFRAGWCAEAVSGFSRTC